MRAVGSAGISALWAKAKKTFAAASHTHPASAVTSGTVGGALSFNSNSLPQFAGKPKYLVGIEAFADGGGLKWQSIGNINVGSADSVPWSGVSGKTNATQSADGLMSAADKAKLDGISSGGGGDYLSDADFVAYVTS